MVINEAELRNLVKRIMELTLELAGSNEKDILLVLSGDDVDSLRSLLASFKCKNCNLTIVASEKQMSDVQLGKLICSKANKVVSPEAVLRDALDFDKVIYLKMPRDILAKCALCVPDVPEVKLFDKALREGVCVSLAKKAIDPFTDCEPEGYRQKILGYVRNLLEYGIEIESDA
jgi:hypothetical protein